jgi:Ca2+-transporting ATPase
MKRKPRDPKSGVFADGMGIDVIYQGVLVAILVLVSFFVGHYMEVGNWEITNSSHGTTMAFLTMAMAEVFHSLNMRSQRKSLFSLKKQNVLLWFAALGSFVLSVAVCAIPDVAGWFKFEPIGFTELALAIALGFCVIPMVELVKLIQRAVARRKNK